MAPASVVVGILAFMFAASSAYLVAVPKAGVACAIVALVLSLVSIVLGGVGMSQASARGESTAFAVTGLVIGICAFLVSFVLAMTCGTCNACVTLLDAHSDGGIDLSLPFVPVDGGVAKPPYVDDDAGKPPFGATPIAPAPPDVDPDDASAASPPAPITDDGGLRPPPPAFPPPPMNRIAPGGAR